MKNYYTSEEIKGLVYNVHDQVNGLLVLVNYCKNAVIGYNEFKADNKMGNDNIDSVLQAFDDAKQQAMDLYYQTTETILNLNTPSGRVEIKSSPMAMASNGDRYAIKNATDKYEMVEAMDRVHGEISRMVDKLMSKVESFKGLEGIVDNYATDGVSAQIKNILSITDAGLVGYQEVSKNVVRPEEKYSDR